MAIAVSATAAVRYVNSSGTGSPAGATAWATASPDLKGVIAASSAGDEIWVAAGTYSPEEGTSYVMKEGVKLYGGFAGKETSLSQRDWKVNVTIIQGNGSRVFDNNFTEAAPLTGFSVLDGFLITGGEGPAPLGGGAMYNNYASPTITNCIFEANKAVSNGGAINNSRDSNPFISNCSFINNTLTGNGGGAMINQIRSSPIIINCKFINNAIGGTYGGAIYNYSGWGSVATPEITNCLFAGNISAIGAGIANASGSEAGSEMTVKITNCTFYGNKASDKGGAIYNERPEKCIVNIQNTLIFGNTATNEHPNFGSDEGLAVTIRYSLIEGLDSDPNYSNTSYHNVLGETTAGALFTSAESGDFSLKVGSKAVNAGSNALNSQSLDLAGNKRIFENIIDIGAYELQVINDVTSVKTHKMELGVFPNPAIDVLKVSGVEGNSHVIVYDITGKIVLEKENFSGEINVSNLKKGIYSILLKDNLNSRSAKFFKQ